MLGMSDREHSDARAIAEIAAAAILRFQAGAPAGALGPELSGLVRRSAVVHQATGMVSAQLDITLADALVTLRAHAFSRERPLTDVATDIVGRSLRLDR